MTAAPLPRVQIKIERKTQHPWIFQKMVEWPAQKIQNGAIVDVLDKAGQW